MSGVLIDQKQQTNKKGPNKWGPFYLFGAPGAIRTPDRLVRSQVLYPAELQAHWKDGIILKLL